MAVINLDVVMLNTLTLTAVKAVTPVSDRVASGNTTGWARPSAIPFYPRLQLQHMQSLSEPGHESKTGGCLEQKKLGRLTRSQLSKRLSIITSAKV